MAYLTPKQRRESGLSNKQTAYVTPRKRRSAIEDVTEANKRVKTLTNLSQGYKAPIDLLPPQQRDQAEQARRAKTLVNLSQEPQYKPLLKEPPQQQTTPIINKFDSEKTGGYLANKAISGLSSTTEGFKASQDMLKPQNRVSILGDIEKQRKQDLTDRLYQERADLEQAGQDKSGFVRTIGNLTEGATGMIPTMALSGMSGGVMGVPFIMGQAGGNAYTQAKQEGADHEQALKYGIGSGLIEGGIEALIGGIPGTKGIADPLIDTATRGIKSNALRGVARFGLDALGEGVEEGLSTIIDPYLKRATYDKNAPLASPGEVAESAAMGAALSAIMSGGQAAINRVGARIGQPKAQPNVQNVSPALNAEATIQAQQEAAPAAPIGGKAQQEFTPIGGKTETPQGRIFGETPTGDIPNGMKERGFSKNVRTDQAMPDDIRTSFDENPLAYDPDTNPETLSRAQDIFNKGETEAISELYKGLNEGIPKPEMVPLAKLLAKQASEQGDTTKARVILSDLADKLTSSGKFSQAAKILREADPETFLMTMDKQLKKLNEQGKKQYGKKWKDIDLTQGEIDAINQIERGNQQSYDDTWGKIGDRIAKELPSTGMEKFDAWRRMAMLLNPKTHIRNVGGNVIMMGMRKASDTIGAALQKAFVPKGQRTQSVGWSLNKDIVAKVNDNWNTVKKDLLGESRWEIDNLKSLGREKRIFNKGLPTKAVEALTGKKFDRGMLQWLNEFSLKTLNVEDNIFVERAYKDALGQYLQANNMDTVTDEAVAYATRRALEATFKQANELASTLNRWKQKPVVGKLVEGAVPFTKTPANIVMRGIEYSPGGIFKALYDVKAGKTAATVIEDLSKGLTGSAIAALGFWLASLGWAKVDRNRSAKAESLYSEMGDQTNAINTPLGSYTFDWAQPFAIPLAMGIAAQEAIRQRKDGDSLIEAIKDGIFAGGDTVFNMTMLQNIRQIIGSYGSPTEKIMGIPIDYLEQAIFSVFGQAARTIDPVKRSIYDPDPTKQWLNTVKARVPGLSQKLEPALNIWGEEQTQGGALQQFINPGYFKPRNDDPVTNELARLYSEVNDTDLLPKVAPNSFTKDKVTYTLTAEQKTEFARQMGQENYIDMRAIIHTDRYQNATDDEKAKMLKKISDKNYEEAKEMIVGK